MADEELHVLISAENAERANDQLSDVLCWLQGFKAAGGEYVYDIEAILTLKCAVKKAMNNDT